MKSLRKSRAFLRRRALTILAVLFMAGSALLAFLIVQENDRHIAELKRSVDKMDQTIRTLWEDAARVERNADMAVIVSLLAGNGGAEAQEIKRYYAGRLGAVSPGALLMESVRAAETEHAHAVDRINDTYLSRLALEDEIMLREAEGKRTATFVFLLQLTGLVLVVLTREMPG